MFYIKNILKYLTDKNKRRVKLLVNTGVIVSVIGGILSLFFPLLLSIGMKSQMQIKIGNEITTNWLDVPITFVVKVHVWNIENPNNFLNGDKPIIKEKGPYFWKQRRWKEIISWGRNEQTVEFWTLQSYNFDNSKTMGELSDKITVINVPVYAMAYIIKSLVDELPFSFAIAPLAFGFVNMLFFSHGEGLLKELTVGELVEGYPFSILDTIDTITKPLKWLGIQLPDNGMPGNKFGLLWVKNYTRGGPYEVYTGRNGTSDKVFQLVSYQGKKSLDFYDDPNCNLLNGSDGTTFGSFLTKDDTIYIFNGDACKSIHLRYKSEIDVGGIPAFRFGFPKTFFASPVKNPDNKCFCRTPNNYEKCDGIFDLGPCQKGAPLAYSFPHLLHCSETIKSGVIGINDSIERHESFFDIEPTLGMALRASAKLQVNVLLKPMPLVPGFGAVRETVVPYVWVEEFVEIDETFGNKIKMATIPIAIITNGSVAAFFVGLILMTIGFVYGIIKRDKTVLSLTEEGISSPDRNQILINETENRETQRLSPTQFQRDETFYKTNDWNKSSSQRVDNRQSEDPMNGIGHHLKSNQAVTQTPEQMTASDTSLFAIRQQRYDSNIGFETQNETKSKIINENSFPTGFVQMSSPPGNVQ